MEQIRGRAAAGEKSIVFPETHDTRVLKAATCLVEQNICRVILVGEQTSIQAVAEKEAISLPDDIEYHSPDNRDYTDALGSWLYERRKHKGITQQEAADRIRKDPLYYAAGLVALNKADGCVAGSVATTGAVIRAAIHCIGMREDTDIVSSIFLMALKENRVLTYADCGVVPYPDAEQLADIALNSARTHQILTGEQPIVAMLSFSTKGSAKHERTELVTAALQKARNKNPDLRIDGELQFDAAFVPEVAKRKAPASAVAGRANVYIFPNLDAGNIAYKITERLAGAAATGPILQGLKKPMMDLSRGCEWQDIVNAACVAILMGPSR